MGSQAQNLDMNSHEHPKFPASCTCCPNALQLSEQHSLAYQLPIGQLDAVWNGLCRVHASPMHMIALPLGFMLQHTWVAVTDDGGNSQ